MKKDKVNSSVKIGWEIECYGPYQATQSFKREIHRVNKNIYFGSDGSIHPPQDWRMYSCFELRTPPLSYEKGMQLLENIFMVMRVFQYTTNGSCGLHLNISFAGMDKIHVPFVVKHPLWSQLTRAFHRTSNPYCKIIRKNKERVSTLEKYNCISLRNVYGDCPKSRKRIEVRGFGGSRYERKFDLIKEYAGKSIALLLNSLNPPMRDINKKYIRKTIVVHISGGCY